MAPPIAVYTTSHTNQTNTLFNTLPEMNNSINQREDNPKHHSKHIKWFVIYKSDATNTISSSNKYASRKFHLNIIPQKPH